MPDMATVCQETAGTPPGMFGARGPQAVGPPHNYYNHCGYSTPTSHSQYGPDGYGPFQASPPDQSPHLQHHVHHQQQPPHPQQAWGYSMGMMGNGRPGHGAISEDWPGQGYLVPNSSTPAQNPYNYAYRGPNSHGPLDYASPMQGGADGDPQGLEGSPSPHTPSPGEPNGTGMGPNNQGAKSLRPPYEWMKPSAALPQAGKTRTKDKYRVVYSDHQRLELEKEFHFSKYITIRRKAEIAAQLGLSERQVKIWFQNRRAKERKQNKKREEQVHIQHSNSMGSSIGSSQDQQHQQQQQLPPPPGHDHHPHPFIPKMEMDEEKPNLHEISIHNTTMTPQGVGLTSAQTTPTPMGLHPNLHASPIMTVAPSVMSRTMVRYHESVSVQRPSVSPTSNADDVAYRVAATADSSSNSMNLSGSSDSGVVSSH